MDYDPNDSVRLGITSLPNAAADAGGGLPISDAGGLDLDGLNTNINDIETDTGTTLDNLIRDRSMVTLCQVSASTSGTSFTIGTCTDHDGGAIVLATDSFVGTYMVAYNRGGTQCPVVGQGVFVDDVTSGGVVNIKSSDLPGSGFSEAPNTSTCDVEVRP